MILIYRFKRMSDHQLDADVEGKENDDRCAGLLPTTLPTPRLRQIRKNQKGWVGPSPRQKWHQHFISRLGGEGSENQSHLWADYFSSFLLLKNRVESGGKGGGWGVSKGKQASPVTCILHISLSSVNLLSLAAKSGEHGCSSWMALKQNPVLQATFVTPDCCGYPSWTRRWVMHTGYQRGTKIPKLVRGQSTRPPNYGQSCTDSLMC